MDALFGVWLTSLLGASAFSAAGYILGQRGVILPFLHLPPPVPPPAASPPHEPSRSSAVLALRIHVRARPVANASAESGDPHPSPGAELRQTDAGAARFDEILAAFEQDRSRALIGLLLGENRLIDDALLAPSQT